MRCCAHILNLIVKDGLGVVKDGVEKIRDSVAYWIATCVMIWFQNIKPKSIKILLVLLNHQMWLVMERVNCVIMIDTLKERKEQEPQL